MYTKIFQPCNDLIEIRVASQNINACFYPYLNRARKSHTGFSQDATEVVEARYNHLLATSYKHI